MVTWRLGLMASCVVLAACSSSAPSSVGGGTGGGGNGGFGSNPTSPVPSNEFQMANGCYAVQSVASNQFALRQDNGSYQFAASDVDGATPFFMKPTNLGTYLLFAEDQSFPAASGGGVGSTDAPSEAAEWSVAPQGEDYSVYSDSAALYLVEGDDGNALLNGDSADSAFRFVPAAGCETFPELTANVDGPTFKGTRPDGTVAGFADAHVHWSATDFLGGAEHGWPYHKYGVEHALNDCQETHGPSGFADLVGGLYGQDFDGHATAGFPEFVEWPGRGMLTHEGMYYKWVERAWKSGLRIMVNDLVENRVLCELVKTTDTVNPIAQQGGPGVQCNEMESVHKQIDFMNGLQDYIDAQYGGPGEGWMRIVGSPAEAREVIAQGKMAVVQGIEISHLFNCQVNYITPVVTLPIGPLLGEDNPGEPENEISEALHAYGQNLIDDRIEEQAGLATDISCTEPGIKAQIDDLWSKGVRQLFPIHEFDNAFGGNGIFDGLILNLGNAKDTGRFWQTYDCPDQEYFFGAGAIMAESAEGLCGLTGSAECSEGANALAPILGPLTGVVNGELGLPVYGSERQCNARWMTPMGDFLMDELMKKGIIIEVDHLELEMKSQLIEKAAGISPAYPLVSTHGGHGGISTQQAKDMLSGGGLIYPYKPNGAGYASFVNKVRDVMPENYPYPFAVGYGADTNGMGGQAGPQGETISYPFTLFQGADWAGVLGEGIEFEPLQFEISQVESSGRQFDINTEGQSHYGLVADFVEQVRVTGGNDALKALYNSAETYLQMWERTLESSASLSD